MAKSASHLSAIQKNARKIAMDSFVEGRMDDGKRILEVEGVNLTKSQAATVAKQLTDQGRTDDATTVLMLVAKKEPKEAKRRLGSIGDVNPIEYGGGPIYSAPEQGGPWVEYYDGLESDQRASRLDNDRQINKLEIQIYRVNLGKDGQDFLNDYDWVDWGDVAGTVGQDPSAYEASKLKTAQARAHAVSDAAGYYGWHEFDGSPLELTVGELRKRWRK